MQQPQQAISITTEQIQKCLDENKKLILAILDNQNLGKFSECAQYQALLQKNLMYLAAIADGQPLPQSTPPQMAPLQRTVQPGFFMQHPQTTTMAQQAGFFPGQIPSQAMQAQMGMGFGQGGNNRHVAESSPQ